MIRGQKSRLYICSKAGRTLCNTTSRKSCAFPSGA